MKGDATGPRVKSEGGARFGSRGYWFILLKASAKGVGVVIVTSGGEHNRRSCGASFSNLRVYGRCVAPASNGVTASKHATSSARLRRGTRHQRD